ncbi:MAG: hypothetical protein JJU41_07030 [Bacteroidetes bacterium]|nr:hypothetical protein [Bacteroidota bacterium]MCH8523457.1 hypothetical protein [Balneolales bacterium]
MSLEINNIRLTTSEVWSDYWKACYWATYAESPDWSRLWSKTYGEAYIATPYLVDYTDGTQLLLPVTSVVRAGKWFEVQLISPSGGYGGPLSSTLPTLHHLALLIEEIPRHFPDYHLRLNPFLLHAIKESIGNSIVVSPELPKPIKSDFTQPVPLDRHTDQVLSKKRARRYANAASKKGYVVKPMEPDEIASYLNVYDDARDRWEQTTVHYPNNFFHNMATLQPCTFFGVYDREDNFCGGGPFLFGNKIATTWLSIMNSNRLQDHIYEFFYYTLILKFREEGYDWFDFNPSGGQSGVVKFKEKFTPLRMDAPVYEGYSWKRLFMITLGRD